MTRDRNPLANRAQATTAAKLPALMRPKAGDWTALLSWVDAVSEHLRVRQGSARNPLEATVTKRELQAATGVQQVIFTNGQGQGGATPSSGGSTVMMQSASGQWVGVTVEAFADLIRNTRLYTDLTGAIDDPTRFDRLTKEVREILLPDLNALALSRGTDIRQTDTKIQDASQSLAARVNELTAAFGRNTAGIRQAMITQATQGSASAVYALQITSRLDGFDGGVATIEEVFSTLADRTSGLAAEYMLKLSAGKAVVGYGLAASEDPLGNTVSDFWIEAGRFAITAPFTFAQESTPTATVIGQTWYKPSTKASKRATATGTGSWVTFAPKVPFGIDTTTDTIYLDGTVLINSGGRSLQAQNAHAYATGSSWSDSAANSALSTLTGSSTKKVGDTVTIANGSTFWQEKYWSGSAWVDPGVIINGNLLVGGTISGVNLAITGSTHLNGTFNLAGTDTAVIVNDTGGNIDGMYVYTSGGAGAAIRAVASHGGPDFGTAVVASAVGTQGIGVDAAGGSAGIGVWGSASTTGYGIYGDNTNTSGWAVYGHGYVGGDSDAIFAGKVKAGGTPNSDAAVIGYGTGTLHGGRFHHATTGNAGFIASGSLSFVYDFYADGTGTNYGPFTGAHDALIPKGAAGPEIGDIVVDLTCLGRSNVSNTIFEVAPSSAPYQKAPLGIATRTPVPWDISSTPAALKTWVEVDGVWEQMINADAVTLSGTHDYFAANAVGEGQINVCGENGDIAAGDYITTSSTPGKGMKQTPFVMTLPDGSTMEVQVQCNFTVAKAREAVTFSEAGEIKLIACTYHCA